MNCRSNKPLQSCRNCKPKNQKGLEIYYLEASFNHKNQSDSVRGRECLRVNENIIRKFWL